MLKHASKKGREGPALVKATRRPGGQWAYRWCIGGMAAYHRWHLLPQRRLPRQRFLEIQGFLNYVVRTYPWLNPYTKGLHLTIGGWRNDQDPEGRRVRPKGSGQILFIRSAHDGEQKGDGHH